MKQPRQQDLRRAIARQACGKARRRHPAKAHVLVAQAVARLRGEQHVHRRHRHHRAHKAQHIAHRQKAHQHAQRRVGRGRQQAAPPCALCSLNPQPDAQKAEYPVEQIESAHRHRVGVDPAERRPQQRRGCQRAAPADACTPQQKCAGAHQQRQPQRVADDARRPAAGIKQEGQRIKKVRAKDADFRGIEPVHLHEAARLRLPARQQQLRRDVAVQIGQIAGLLQRRRQRQRSQAQAEPDHNRIAPFLPLHAHPPE